MDKYTVNGTVTDLNGGPLQGLGVTATAVWNMVRINQKVSSVSPTDEDVGAVQTGADGKFSLTFDWDVVKARMLKKAASPKPLPVGSPQVYITVTDPLLSQLPLARTARKNANAKVFTFTVMVISVAVDNWQLHYPSGASEFKLGDIAVLSAVVTNRLPREVGGLGIRVVLRPLKLDDILADANKEDEDVDPFETELITNLILEPAGTPQTGRTSFEPNPLSRKPVSIAFFIPLMVTVTSERIPGSHTYTFAPSGVYSLDASLIAEGRPAGSTSMRVKVKP